jgi:hypothetical protein
LARSSKPRYRYAPTARYRLILTCGGGADLIELATGELTWCGREDGYFQAEFPYFLEYEHAADILEYLEDTGELTRKDADNCQIVEEFLTLADLAGMLRVPTQE